MSKDSSAKYCQSNNEKLQKKLAKYIEVFIKKKTKKTNNMVVDDTKISKNMMKNKSLLSIEKNILK